MDSNSFLGFVRIMLGHIAEKTVQTGQGEEKYRQFRLVELLSDPLHHLRVEAAVETVCLFPFLVFVLFPLEVLLFF